MQYIEVVIHLRIRVLGFKRGLHHSKSNRVFIGLPTEMIR